MTTTDHITTSDGLSQTLITILHKAGITTYFTLSRKTRLGLRKIVPQLKVRHLTNLESALALRDYHFYPDDSILCDEFINQRKLFNLWAKGTNTYQELDKLPYEEFVTALGGPNARFFRKKKESMMWLAEHNMEKTKHFKLPHLTLATAKLLFNGDVLCLQELVTKSDVEIAKVLQPGFGKGKVKAGPLTKARLTEIKYALFKEGIHRSCMPL